MLGNHLLQAIEWSQIVVSQSAANTTAASSSATYIDVRKYEGDLIFLCDIGALTGSCTPDIQDATDTGGSGTASIAAIEGAYTAFVASTFRKYTVPAGSTRGFIRMINTVVTGPVLIGVVMGGHPKYT